jgi:hypothetical protein
MKFKRSNILFATFVFVGSSVLLQLGPETTSWSKEFAIFNMKVSGILFAVWLCTDKPNDQNN